MYVVKSVYKSDRCSIIVWRSCCCWRKAAAPDQTFSAFAREYQEDESSDSLLSVLWNLNESLTWKRHMPMYLLLWWKDACKCAIFWILFNSFHWLSKSSLYPGQISVPLFPWPHAMVFHCEHQQRIVLIADLTPQRIHFNEHVFVHVFITGGGKM